MRATAAMRSEGSGDWRLDGHAMVGSASRWGAVYVSQGWRPARGAVERLAGSMMQRPVCRQEGARPSPATRERMERLRGGVG